MAKVVATPKETSGSGFAYEDKVVAYYLVWMLAGINPLADAGQIARIDCQVVADGWFGFDDVLVTVAEKDGDHRYALSVKSTSQFAKEAAAQSLVESAWSTVLHTRSKVFDPGRDAVGLVCPPLSEPQGSATKALLGKARWQSPGQLAERLHVKGYASDSERGIHASFACPSGLSAGQSAEQLLPANVLRILRVIELDFDRVDSLEESRVLFVCSELTAPGDEPAARVLWSTACQLSQKLRAAGGGIARDESERVLAAGVELRRRPEHEQDWRRVDAWVRTELSSVNCRIGGSASVDRRALVADIGASLLVSRFVSLVGASGTGKTAAAMQVAEGFRAERPVLWLAADRLRNGYVESLAEHFHLSHPLPELLGSGRVRRGLVVVDGAERLTELHGYREVSLLLHLLGMDRVGGVWCVLFTCREEAWTATQVGLLRAFGHQARFEPIEVRSPELEELAAVWESFPVLHRLAVRPHLARFLRNLKVLDLLAHALLSGRDLDRRPWIGESDVVRWYWQDVVSTGAKGPKTAELVVRLAITCADQGRFEIAAGDLSADELDLIPETADLLRYDSLTGTVCFAHDLLADWARFRALVAHGDDLGSYCHGRLSNPHWIAALRLYGVSVLEADPTGSMWKHAMDTLTEGRESLLESLVFAGNLEGLTETAWPTLAAGSAALLVAFLKRFQHVATIPNPAYMQVADKAHVRPEELRSWDRIPLWMYWIGLLRALHRRAVDLIDLAPSETARVARTWLRQTPHTWPARQEAAALSIGVARKAADTWALGGYSAREDRVQYEALLEAYHDQPQEVREVLLQCAGRVVPPAERIEALRNSAGRALAARFRWPLPWQEGILQEPWPDGPLFRSDGAFRSACLETDSLRTTMVYAPDLASELVLALLIELRVPEEGSGSSGSYLLPQRALCLQDEQGFFPRFYTRGPFLLFLKVNPEAGLHCIVRLVDFAAARWMEHHYPPEQRGSGIDIRVNGQPKRFVGDADVYHWYHGVAVSDVVTSALMAVEKWLYDLADSESDLRRQIARLLDTATSAAFLGMLSEVGRYVPDLFTRELRPLLLVPDAYYLEAIFAHKGGLDFGTPMSLAEGEWFFEVARAWDTMPHRSRRLIDIGAQLFHRHPATREALLSVRDEWRDRSGRGDETWRHYVDMLLATFDATNWREETSREGAKLLAFEPPEYLRPRPAETAEVQNQLLLLTLPTKCRTMLTKNVSLEVGEIGPFLEQSRGLLGKSHAGGSAPLHAVLGSIAVVYVRHRDWLRANPVEESWCLQIVRSVIAGVGSPRAPWGPERGGDDSWEAFAGDIVAVAWGEHPSSWRLRRDVARLCLGCHPGAAQALLARAFERRDALGPRFWGLVSLLLEWAIVRHRSRMARYAGVETDLRRVARRAARRFAWRGSRTSQSRWGEASVRRGVQVVAARRRWPRGPRVFRPEVPDIDANFIQGLFGSILMPQQAKSESERRLFLSFWEQALTVALAKLRVSEKHTDDQLQRQRLPDGYDYWVLGRVAVVAAEMRPQEDPERLWGPILSLGPQAEHWVEHFLYHWFTDGRERADVAFFDGWTRMIGYCVVRDTWSTKEPGLAYELPALWLCLVGVGRFGGLWQAGDAPVVERATWWFVSLAPRILVSPGSAVRLIHWLTEPAAKGIQLAMLQPLAEAGLGETQHWWSERGVARAIAGYLNVLWDESGPVIDGDSVLRGRFLDLLSRASGAHEPTAMDLQSRIASRR